MRRVLAAIDESPCAGPVLDTAHAVADLFDARVLALHVREDGSPDTARDARRRGLELREADGEPVAAIAQAAEDPAVVAVVLGARGAHTGPRPAGHTALRLITQVRKPVVVVPPDGAGQEPITRILTPLEGSRSSSEAIAGTLALAERRALDILVLHVHTLDTLPPFGDQPGHEAASWEREFAARFVALPRASVRIVQRVGAAGDCVLAEAADAHVDLIVLGWNRDLSPGRARVVREALAHSPVAVALVGTAADSTRAGITADRDVAGPAARPPVRRPSG